ncbi:restriction endonuclease subunit S [Clostridium sp. JNZ X4-2]
MENNWKKCKLGEVYEFASGLSKKREEFGFGYEFITFKDIFNNYFIPDQLTELANSTEKERKKCSVKRGDVFLTRTSEKLEELGMSSVALKDYPYLRVTDVTNGYIDIEQIKYIDYDTRSKISKYIIRYEDVYISIAGTIGVVGTIYKDIDNASLTENMARIIVSNSNVFRNYIRIYLQSREGQNNIKSRTVGSTQPKLPLYAIRAIPIIIPPNKIINDFAKFVNPMIEKIESNLNEISYLKAIRDTLLPKLISGEIKL